MVRVINGSECCCKKTVYFVQCNKLHGEENYVSHWKAEKYRDKR